MVEPLKLDHFFNRIDDQEQSYYNILAALDPYKKAFRSNRLQPYLDLIENVITNIREVLHNQHTIQEHDARVDQIFNLMELTYDDIQNTYYEGLLLEEFVKSNIQLEHIGVIPDYIHDGYCILHDNKRAQIHVYRYAHSISYPFHLDIRRICSMANIGIIPDMRSIKLKLISDYKDLPIPAMWELHTTLDFPFERTILPVSKIMIAHIF